MRRIIISFLICLFVGPTPLQARPADLVFRNGSVYTVDARHPRAEALAVKGGRIVFVGRAADLAPHIGPRTRIVDLRGGMLLPGFQDTHVHLLDGGVDLGRCDLYACESIAEVSATIRAYARAHPRLPCVVGAGWGISLFPGCNPSRELLDRLVPDRPAFFWASDGHNGWANSRALAAAGITASTPDPPRGRIERDAHGNPSGTLREAAATGVTEKLSPVSFDESLRGLLTAQARAHAAGITTIHDARVTRSQVAVWQAAEAKGRLTLRVVASLETDPTRGPEQVDDLVKLRASATRSRVRLTAAKIFLDGVIETHTAAMLAPYADRPHDRGISEFAPDALRALALRLDEAGFQIHMHAIGDRAVRDGLDAIEAVTVAHGPRDRRPHIAHVQLIDPADRPRFPRLGVAANFQSYWLQDNSDSKVDRVVLGPSRYAQQYPARSMWRCGARVVGGSDWPVTTLAPLDAIEVAVTHRALGDAHGAVYIPDERVSLAQAIQMYTRNAAWLGFDEARTGTLEVGRRADLVVLDHDLFKLPSHRIHAARVMLTVADGVVVYRRR